MPDGNRITKNNLEGEFFNWLFSHHQKCKRPRSAKLELKNFKKDGFGSMDSYACTCGAPFIFKTSPQVKTQIVSKGRSFSISRKSKHVSKCKNCSGDGHTACQCNFPTPRPACWLNTESTWVDHNFF